MQIKEITNKAELELATERLITLSREYPEASKAHKTEFKKLSKLVEDYEDKHYPFPIPIPEQTRVEQEPCNTRFESLTTIKILKRAGRQSLTLPEALWFKGTFVHISKQGDSLILTPESGNPNKRTQKTKRQASLAPA